MAFDSNNKEMKTKNITKDIDTFINNINIWLSFLAVKRDSHSN